MWATTRTSRRPRTAPRGRPLCSPAGWRTGVASGPTIRIGDERAGDERQQLVVRGDERPQRPRGRAVPIESVDRDRLRLVGEPELGQLLEGGDGSGWDRVVDARPDLDVGGVEAALPRRRERE